MTVHRVDTIKNSFITMYGQDEVRGNVSLCCSALSVPRGTYYKWMKEDEEFRNAIHEKDAVLNDDLEQVLISRAVDKSDTALIYYLKYNHPKYKEEAKTLIQVNAQDMQLNFIGDESTTS